MPKKFSSSSSSSFSKSSSLLFQDDEDPLSPRSHFSLPSSSDSLLDHLLDNEVQSDEESDRVSSSSFSASSPAAVSAPLSSSSFPAAFKKAKSDDLMEEDAEEVLEEENEAEGTADNEESEASDDEGEEKKQLNKSGKKKEDKERNESEEQQKLSKQKQQKKEKENQKEKELKEAPSLISVVNDPTSNKLKIKLGDFKAVKRGSSFSSIPSPSSSPSPFSSFPAASTPVPTNSTTSSATFANLLPELNASLLRFEHEVPLLEHLSNKSSSSSFLSSLSLEELKNLTLEINEIKREAKDRAIGLENEMRAVFPFTSASSSSTLSSFASSSSTFASLESFDWYQKALTNIHSVDSIEREKLAEELRNAGGENIDDLLQNRRKNNKPRKRNSSSSFDHQMSDDEDDEKEFSRDKKRKNRPSRKFSYYYFDEEFSDFSDSNSQTNRNKKQKNNSERDLSASLAVFYEQLETYFQFPSQEHEKMLRKKKRSQRTEQLLLADHRKEKEKTEEKYDGMEISDKQYEKEEEEEEDPAFLFPHIPAHPWNWEELSLERERIKAEETEYWKLLEKKEKERENGKAKSSASSESEKSKLKKEKKEKEKEKIRENEKRLSSLAQLKDLFPLKNLKLRREVLKENSILDPPSYLLNHSLMQRMMSIFVCQEEEDEGNQKENYAENQEEKEQQLLVKRDKDDDDDSDMDDGSKRKEKKKRKLLSPSSPSVPSFIYQSKLFLTSLDEKEEQKEDKKDKAKKDKKASISAALKLSLEQRLQLEFKSLGLFTASSFSSPSSASSSLPAPTFDLSNREDDEISALLRNLQNQLEIEEEKNYRQKKKFYFLSKKIKDHTLRYNLLIENENTLQKVYKKKKASERVLEQNCVLMDNVYASIGTRRDITGFTPSPRYLKGIPREIADKMEEPPGYYEAFMRSKLPPLSIEASTSALSSSSSISSAAAFANQVISGSNSNGLYGGKSSFSSVSSPLPSLPYSSPLSLPQDDLENIERSSSSSLFPDIAGPSTSADSYGFD